MEFVSRYGNVEASSELVNRIVSETFNNPDSDLCIGENIGEKPSMDDQLFAHEVYGDITEYLREGVRLSSGVYVTPQWCRTQDWYKQLWAEATGFDCSDIDLDDVSIPESDWELVPYPNLVVCCADYGNTGWYWLFTVTNSEYDSYNPEGGIEYGASGGAYMGCYCEDDTKGITEWCSNILEEIEEGNLFL